MSRFLVGGTIPRMLEAAQLGQSIPVVPLVPPLVELHDADDDLGCVATYATPRPPEVVEHLAQLILTRTLRAKYWIVWGVVTLGLWILGTATALVITRLAPSWGSAPILALGFGGLGTGLASGALWIVRRRSEARTIAREGQLVAGIATSNRGRETFGGELSEMLALPLGETRTRIVFSIGFIRHELWVAFPAEHDEGECLHVLVQPGARLALAFDAQGHGYVGELARVR